MRSSIVVLMVVAVGSGCAAGAPASRGPTTAGPTLAPGPDRESDPSPVPFDLEPSAAPVVTRTGASVCELFDRRQVSGVLGLRVASAEVVLRGQRVVCTWRALDAPPVPRWRVGDPVLAHDDGVVSLTRAPGDQVGVLEGELTRAARRRNADAREEVEGIGRYAFAIGSSVSGVPLWSALAVHDGVVTVVEVSGAGSRSGVVAVKEFLAETLRRG